MKLFQNKWMFALLLLVVTASFVACGSDDDGEGGASSVSESNLIGLWEVVDEEAYVTYEGQRTQVSVNYMKNDRIGINSDHTCAVYDYNSSTGDYVQDDDSRTWTLSGNVITLTINGHKISHATITELSANRLVWVNTEEEDGQKLELYQTMNCNTKNEYG